MRPSLENTKILIAGAGGYIGSALTKHLLKRGYKILALDRFFFGEEILNDCKPRKNLSILKEDTRFFNRKILRDVNAVVDLSGLSNDPSSELNPYLTKSINIDGCIRLARLSKEMHVKRYIFSSSCSVYGNGKDPILTEESKLNPLTLYAKSKATVEKELLTLADDHFNTTIARNATCYGISPRMRFDLAINLMTLNAHTENVTYVNGDGKQWRPFVHVLDVARAYEKILQLPPHVVNKQIFNIGSNEQNYQLIEVARMVSHEFSKCKLKILNNTVDSRDYKVNFDKARSVLKFFPKMTVIYGVKEIKTALENHTINFDIKTLTVNFYKYLMTMDSLLQKVKYKDILSF